LHDIHIHRLLKGGGNHISKNKNGTKGARKSLSWTLKEKTRTRRTYLGGKVLSRRKKGLERKGGIKAQRPEAALITLTRGQTRIRKEIRKEEMPAVWGSL